MNTFWLFVIAAIGFVLACLFASIAGGSYTDAGRRRSWIVCVVSFMVGSVSAWTLFVRASMFRINSDNPEHAGLFIWLLMLVLVGVLWKISDEKNRSRRHKRCVP